MSKKLPNVLNVQCNHKMAECCLLQLAATKINIMTNFMKQSIPIVSSMLYGNLKFTTLIYFLNNIISLYDAAAVNIPTDIESSWICYAFH